jgi:hypothetical protein
MKVDRTAVKPVFMPITIVLETEEEAVAMWHRLNTNGSKILNLPKDSRRDMTMWEIFNKAYSMKCDPDGGYEPPKD